VPSLPLMTSWSWHRTFPHIFEGCHFIAFLVASSRRFSSPLEHAKLIIMVRLRVSSFHSILSFDV
jgi:hypothetical protein